MLFPYICIIAHLNYFITTEAMLLKHLLSQSLYSDVDTSGLVSTSFPVRVQYGCVCMIRVLLCVLLCWQSHDSNSPPSQIDSWVYSRVLLQTGYATDFAASSPFHLLAWLNKVSGRRFSEILLYGFSFFIFHFKV